MMQKLKTPGRLLAASLISGVALLMFGCGISAEKAVHERATAYWNAVVVGDYVTAYAFERVSVDKPSGLQQYMATKGAIRYVSAEVLGVEMKNPEQATVKVRLAYTLTAMMRMREPVVSEVTTSWVKHSGQWYNEPVRAQ